MHRCQGHLSSLCSAWEMPPEGQATGAGKEKYVAGEGREGPLAHTELCCPARCSRHHPAFTPSRLRPGLPALMLGRLIQEGPSHPPG